MSDLVKKLRSKYYSQQVTKHGIMGLYKQASVEFGDLNSCFTEIESLQSQLKQKDAEIAELKELLWEACGEIRNWMDEVEQLVGVPVRSAKNPFLNKPEIKKILGGGE